MTAGRVPSVVALLALVAGAANAQGGPVPAPREQAGQQPGGRPVLRPERVAMEVVGGTYAGVAGYLVGRGIGSVATMMMTQEQEHLRDEITHGVGVAGAAFAIGGTVFAIGDMGSESGSFPMTMVGVSAGAATSLLLSRLVFHGRTPADKGSARRKWLAATLECSLPALGGTIAFNSTRKWQR